MNKKYIKKKCNKIRRDEITNKIKKCIKHKNIAIKSKGTKLDKKIKLNKMLTDEVGKKVKLKKELKTK